MLSDLPDSLSRLFNVLEVNFRSWELALSKFVFEMT